MKYAIIAAAVLLSGCGDKSDGSKIGVIVHFTKTGFICKTWEGEIIKGGFSNGSGANGTSMHFTVEDPALIEPIQKAMETQEEVVLHYHQELATLCRSDSDDVFVERIDRAVQK